jgi:hypothetical protein
MRAPKTFDWPHNVPGRMRAGMQGQAFVTVLDHKNLPGTPLSKVIILMGQRRVSNVHVHDATDVYVDVLEGTPRGALTLAGDDLEHAVWTGRYQSLWLPPGVPHVAVYPGPVGGGVDGPDLLAMETRTSSVADADIRVCHGYGPLLTKRLEVLGLIDRVDPSPQMLGQDEVPESSCSPTRPER